MKQANVVTKSLLGESAVLEFTFLFDDTDFQNGIKNIRITDGKSYVQGKLIYLGEDYKNFLAVVPTDMVSHFQERVAKVQELRGTDLPEPEQEETQETTPEVIYFVETKFDGTFDGLVHKVGEKTCFEKRVGKSVSFFDNFADANKFRNTLLEIDEDDDDDDDYNDPWF